MKEEKKTFKEKWQDKKYQAKVKLSGYGIFILIIILMLAIGGGSASVESENINNNIDNNLDDNVDETYKNNVSFSKPTVTNYEYIIEIISEKENVKEEIYYYGRVFEEHEELTKKVDEEEYSYKIINDKYYILNNDNYVLTTKEEVYNILDFNYLNIDNINNYLAYSKLIENSKHQVYLKDIILDNDTEDYITFTLEEDNICIDYTSLINNLTNEKYNSYIVKIEYTD